MPVRWQASALAALPRMAARLEGGARLGGIDWARTRAFSEELNYFPSIWLNVRGRDPLGLVDPGQSEAVIQELTRDLLALRDPCDGERVVERVLRREQYGDGPFADRLPDLVMELREPGGYSYASMTSRGGSEREALRKLRSEECSGARGTSMPGAHRTRGMCLLAGPAVRPGRFSPGTLADAGATAMALGGCAPDPRADGRPWLDCIEAPRDLPAPDAGERERFPIAYTRSEEEEIAERLRALGYLA
jgi:hypothetical protein